MQQPAPPIAAALDAAAKAAGVEPALLRAVAWVESRFNPLAVSKKGATGLLQLMPATAKAFGVTDANNPVQNAHAGAQYLAQLIRKYAGDTERALAAYNWGPRHVDQLGEDGTQPDQVRVYVERVLERWRAERNVPPPLPAAARAVTYTCSCGARLELREVEPR